MVIYLAVKNDPIEVRRRWRDSTESKVNQLHRSSEGLAWSGRPWCRYVPGVKNDWPGRIVSELLTPAIELEKTLISAI